MNYTGRLCFFPFFFSQEKFPKCEIYKTLEVWGLGGADVQSAGILSPRRIYIKATHYQEVYAVAGWGYNPAAGSVRVATYWKLGVGGLAFLLPPNHLK